jgi:hypothetical protein
MKTFQVADLNAQGEVRASQPYDYATLERIPGCSDLIARFSGQIYQAPEQFQLELSPGTAPITFRWHASAPTAGIATIRAGDALASISILATGIVPDADEITLTAFQRHLTHELHDTGFEPAFGLLELRERPIVATITFESPDAELDQLLVALADRCFAAAYFRFHALA